MEAAFGWTLLSPEAIRKAEARLREDAQGVRDEIGFLFLHQAYADRFFPGTSVQQTRLRYALFVPWIYQRVSEMDYRRRRQHSIEKLILEEEVWLTGRLLKSDEKDGVIGKKVYPQRRASSQPATMVYWSSLGRWGLLRKLEDGTLPSRAAVHRLLATDWQRGVGLDDDGAPLQEAHSLFSTLPKPPDGWRNQAEPVTLALLPDESSFLKKQLLATRRSGGQEPSLLARLAEDPGRVRSVKVPWDKAIRAVADTEDRAALDRARRAASLAAVGRAIYGSLVEALRDERDGLQTSRKQRSNLAKVIETHQHQALDADIPSICADAPGLPAMFIRLLGETQEWLRRPNNPMSLLPLYAPMEEHRKKKRARLAPTPIGRQRRAEWDNEKHLLAEPLHYRWSNVRRMLLDLDDHD